MLESFRCSTGPWYEADAERAISERLFARHSWRQPHTDHRVLLLELDDIGLVAVGAHEEDLLKAPDGSLVTGTYLEIGAVALDYQGAVLPEVEPLDPDGTAPTLGRYLMEAVLSDVVERNRGPYLRAIVARENERSLRLCTRIGLVDEADDADERFVQRRGRLVE